MRFSERFRGLMAEHHASVEEVADYLGYTKGKVSGYARGVHNPSLVALLEISEFFGMSVSELLEDVDE